MSSVATHSEVQTADARVLAVLLASHRRFLEFLQRRVESREAAEDILQTALAKAVETAAEVANPDSSVAWFYRVLRNAITDHYRRRATREHVLTSDITDELDSTRLDPELHREVCACFEALIPTLKSEYAVVLRAVDLEGRPIGEVAQELDITSNNVSVRLHRAREALKLRLKQTCSTCAEHGCLDCTCASAANREHKG